MIRFPADLATRELSELANVLREDASKEPAQRRMIGTSPRTLLLAADVLARIALREDARDLIDGRRKAMPMLKAVEEVMSARDGGAIDWPDAIKTAAAALNLDPNTVRRHWNAYLSERGIAKGDYLF